MKEIFTLSAGTAVLATTQAITEATPVNMSIVVALVGAACGFAYWHGRKVEENTQVMRAHNARLEAGDKRFDDIETQVEKVRNRVTAIEIKCRIEHKNKTQRVTLEGE
jgi:uncharacterized protein YdgA (DUF945 family)